MKKTIAVLIGLASGILSAADALPQVTVNSVTPVDGRKFTVSYTLDRDAVVTFDVLTNGVSIGKRHCTSAMGDVFKLVQAGSGTFTWYANRDWPGQSAVNAKIQVRAWSKSAPPDYMVVKLGLKTDASETACAYYECAEQVPDGVTNLIYKTEKMVMRKIPAANVTFRMGSPTGESGRSSGETPHYVTFTNDFYLSVFELSDAQYNRMNEGSASGTAIAHSGCYNHVRSYGITEHPCWPKGLHAEEDSGKMIYKARLRTGLLLDLPTEAEWEFACRAGTEGAIYGESLDRIAWYDDNSKDGTGTPVAHEIGLKEPNSFGLYDMLGNMMECVLDYWQAVLPETDQVAPVGPDAPDTTNGRALRGGSYAMPSANERAAARLGNPANYTSYSTYGKCIGFRLWCPAEAVR